MREKLIEIMREYVNPAKMFNCEQLADHLIENGVTFKEKTKNELLAEYVTRYGRKKSCCVIYNENGKRFEVCNFLCDGKIYFVVWCERKVIECMDLTAGGMENERETDPVTPKRNGWMLKAIR